MGKSLPSYPGAKTVIGGIPGTDKTIKIGQRTAHLLQPIRVLQEWNKFWWGRHDSFWDAAIGHVIGRKYDVDMNMARRHLYYQFNEIVNGKPGVNAQGQETGLKAGRRIAVKNKDWDTVKKLDRNIAEFEREMARLKPYVIKKKQTGKRTRRRIR